VTRRADLQRTQPEPRGRGERLGDEDAEEGGGIGTAAVAAASGDALVPTRFSLGQMVALRDEFGDWYAAQVMVVRGGRRGADGRAPGRGRGGRVRAQKKVDPGGVRCRYWMHFRLWTSMHDNWLTLPEEEERVADLRARVWDGHAGHLRVGMLVDLFQRSRSQWVWASVRAYDASRGQFSVKPRGKHEAAEWVEASSALLKPWGAGRGISVKPYRPQRQSNQLQEEQKRVVLEGSAPWEWFARGLDALGLRLARAEGDGNCLFRSLAHQIYGDQELHRLVRHACVSFIAANRDVFAPFCTLEEEAEGFEGYVALMARERTWGGEPELQAAAMVYGRAIEVYAYAAPPAGARVLREFRAPAQLVPPAGSRLAAAALPNRVLRLSFYGGGHYDSVVGDRDFVDGLLPLRLAGETERRVLELAQQYMQRVRDSAMTAEDRELRAAMDLSRRAFDEDRDLEVALQASAFAAADDDPALVAALAASAELGAAAPAAAAAHGAGGMDADADAAAGAGAGSGAGAAAGGGRSDAAEAAGRVVLDRAILDSITDTVESAVLRESMADASARADEEAEAAVAASLALEEARRHEQELLEQAIAMSRQTLQDDAEPAPLVDPNDPRVQELLDAGLSLDEAIQMVALSAPPAAEDEDEMLQQALALSSADAAAAAAAAAAAPAPRSARQ
jgi:hypothetical protein